MFKNSRNRIIASSLSHRLSYRWLLFFSLLILTQFILAGCGGGKNSGNGNPQPTNVGGGYTLEVSGGTLNDGSGVNGLTVLATLRDGQGWGPTLPWTITITGQGIQPLTLVYDDLRLGSYMSWEWAGFDPLPGAYRATATNGAATIYCDFTITTTTLARPAPNASASGNDITLAWPAVTGAGSYAYDVCAPDFTCISGVTTTTSEIVSFGTLTTGDYHIQVDAYATDRDALYVDHAAAPGLAPQENVSEYFFTFPVGGDQTSANYGFNAAGGILDYGLRGPNNTPIYGLAIWTSIQDLTTKPTPTAPAGDWNIVITDPNGLVMNYVYPAGDGQNANWYYGIEPVSGGTYTVTATYGTASETAAFSFADTNPNLAPLSVTATSSDISAFLVSNTTNTNVNDISISWPPVTNAQSYYASLWADVWNNSTKQYEYDEVWGNWVNTTSVRVLNGEVGSGLQCDVYVDAYAVDMTTTAPPATPPTRADMSENYYGYPLPFVAP